MKKVVLAYSGGLDTTIILKWLLEKGYEVICFLGNVGQNEDFEAAKQKALKIGAAKVYVEDLRKEFLEDYVFRALMANAMYEGRYLLGTSLARPLLAKRQIEIARNEGTTIVAHGATGKGNDQVRFEITYKMLMPESVVISPWKEQDFLQDFKGRGDMIRYAKQQGIPVTSTVEKPYSIDENMLHTSYEGGVLENPGNQAPEDMFQRTVSPQNAPEYGVDVAIDFIQGCPVRVLNQTDGTVVSESSIAVVGYLNELGGKHGIGRVDIVENRFVGMKSRGVYETPAGTILWQAHRDLEALVLDREVFHIKDMWMPKVAELIYNGFWFSPEMDFLMAAIVHSQKYVDGRVYMHLYKGGCFVTKRESPRSLYNEDTASMDRLGNYDQLDAKGFITLMALRLQQCRKGVV